jgi:hypothetical protein
MLLFDRVIEHGTRVFKRRHHKHGMEAVLWSLIKEAPVYDLSDLVPLAQDWEKESKQLVPRRPPFDSLWAEWEIHDAEQNEDGIAGALITKANLPKFGLTPPTLPAGAAGEPWYVLPFLYIHLHGTHRTINVSSVWFTFWLGEDDCRVAHAPIPMKDRWLFDLDEAVTSDCGMILPWPPFFAFALLHCKNIVTETHTPSEREQRQVARAGNPPRTSYKTLKIEVPRGREEAAGHDHAEGDGTPKRRFHICSGHFRRLQSDYFKGKKGQVIWVQAHYRGSKSLGEVHTRFKLSPQDP